MEREHADVGREILRQAAWLRRRIGGFVADPAHLDDVLQATFCVALESPPSDFTRMRAWLWRVACNEVGKRHRRSRCRRNARHLVALRGTVPAAAAIAERRDARLFVRRTVLDLPRPYREVLVLHALDGLPLCDVASILRRPPATVRSQARRGRALLRSRLESLLPV